jgi:hypothetical protein
MTVYYAERLARARVDDARAAVEAIRAEGNDPT